MTNPASHFITEIRKTWCAASGTQMVLALNGVLIVAVQPFLGPRLAKRDRSRTLATGALFTAAIQSSTATILTVIGFVSAGLVTFSQAVGITIGATLGTTSTP